MENVMEGDVREMYEDAYRVRNAGTRVDVLERKSSEERTVFMGGHWAGSE